MSTLFSVLVIYTIEAALLMGPPSSARDLAYREAAKVNALFADNQIPAVFDIVAMEPVPIYDTGDVWTTFVDATAYVRDAQMQEAHGADIVVVLTAEHEGSTGYSLTDCLLRQPRNGFIAIRVRGATHRTVAHELGHLFCAEHNAENQGNDFRVLPYAEAHQAQGYDGVRYRSIMYSGRAPCGSARCRRLPYFSDPNRSHLGAVLGLPGIRDNARVVREIVNRLGPT